MIKTVAKLPDGKNLLVIGLSFGNLRKFEEAPLDSFIRIKGEELDIPLDVMIFSCKTEADGADMLIKGGFVGPETKVTVSDKLKQ